MTSNVRCPGCRLLVASDMLVDVSEAPDELTGGLEEACTGCLDGWYRRGRTIDGKTVTRADILEAIERKKPKKTKVDRSHPYWGSKAKKRK